MNCQSCGSNMVVSVSAKCYDMCTISYGNKGTTSHVPSNMGLGANPNCVEFNYCLQCGTIQGEFPRQLPIGFRPQVAITPPLVNVYLTDIVQQFYDAVMNNDKITVIRPLLSVIISRLQPSDAEVLSGAYQKFQSLRNLHPRMQEFDETVNWIKNNYKHIIVQQLHQS